MVGWTASRMLIVVGALSYQNQLRGSPRKYIHSLNQVQGDQTYRDVRKESHR